MENERVARTKLLLERYDRMTAFVENAKKDIADYNAMLAEDPGAKVPGYGIGGGGTSELTEEERAYCTNEETRRKAAELAAEVARVEPTVNRIKRGLGSLERADRVILESRYVYHYTWGTTRRPHFRGSGKRRRNRHVYQEPEPAKPVKVGSLADDIREANRLKIDYGIYKAHKMGRM